MNDYWLEQEKIFKKALKEKELQHKTHIKFTNNFGGKVFYIYSGKEGSKKIIKNQEVIPEIETEISRLNNI